MEGGLGVHNTPHVNVLTMNMNCNMSEWSSAMEAARYLETYKAFEHKGPELIAEKPDATDLPTLVPSIH